MTTHSAKKSLFVAVLVALTFALVGTALATTFEPVLPTDPSNPAFFDPQVNVTPSDSLADGQVVSVDGTGFGGNQSGIIRQCTEDRGACSASTTPFTTGRNGNFGPFNNPVVQTDPQSVPVPFTVHVTFIAAGTGALVNCFPSACIVDVLSSATSEIARACHHLTFGIVDATPCIQPTSVTSTSSSTVPTSSTTTVPPTTTTTVPPTTTTVPATTTTTTMATTTTTMATTTTTSPGGVTTTTLPALCPSLQGARQQFNAQIDAFERSFRQAFSGPSLTQVLAQLEATRASGNATFAQAAASCPV
jgi:hypothetical protein